MVINTKHNLYVIKSYNKNGESLIKFGYSANIKSRINQYISHNPFTELLYTFYKENGESAELYFHKHNLSAFKNEWYSISKLETIINYIENDILIPEKTIRRKKISVKYTNFIFVENNKCLSCEETKSRDYFSKDTYEKTGLSRRCKICETIKNKKYRNK